MQSPLTAAVPTLHMPVTTSQTPTASGWLFDDRALAAAWVRHPWTWVLVPTPPHAETGTASTVKAFQHNLQRVESLYIVKDAPSVREFIRQQPLLADLLVEAYMPLNEFFGPNPQVGLSVVRDPEQEGVIELLASILTPLDPVQALERLDAFDEYWFLNQLDRVNGRLNFNLEFV